MCSIQARSASNYLPVGVGVGVGVAVSLKLEYVRVGDKLEGSISVEVTIVRVGGVLSIIGIEVGVAVSLKLESVGVIDELEGRISVEVEISGVEKTRVGNKVTVATFPVVDIGKEATLPVKVCVGNKAVEVAISARDSLVFYLPTVEATYLFREVAEEVAEEMTEETTYNWPSH